MSGTRVGQKGRDTKGRTPATRERYRQTRDRVGLRTQLGMIEAKAQIKFSSVCAASTGVGILSDHAGMYVPSPACYIYVPLPLSLTFHCCM